MDTRSIAAGQATSGSLTGLYGREAILSKLGELIQLAAHHKQDLSLNLLKVDRFEVISNDHGHLAGDRVLARTATSIRRNTRETDFVGQYDEGEFVIILPETNLSSCWVVAERLRGIVEKAKMKDPAGHAFTVTVSQGLVWTPW